MMFGDYMNPDAEPEERVYSEVQSLEEMYKIVEQGLEEYNNTHKNRMNLVIFRLVGIQLTVLIFLDRILYVILVLALVVGSCVKS